MKSETSSREPSSRMTPGRSLPGSPNRSEEHTSELQSQSNLVCRLLLEKKTSQPSPRTLYVSPDRRARKPPDIAPSSPTPPHVCSPVRIPQRRRLAHAPSLHGTCSSRRV